MSDDQVAPELKPIKTKLEGILGELKQLQATGTPTQAQLSPVHEQLRSIDEMYVDEKFEINGTVPSGQAVCADLLSEAHELVENIQELIPDDDE
ncbi:hypothetical protein WJX79_010114 [Trebouxia sp. C0005]